MDFSVDAAVQRLGILRSEAKELDALDGKNDGKIAKDIWSQAEEELANIKQDNNDDNCVNLSGLSKVGKALARTIAQRMGKTIFWYSEDKNLSGDDISDKVSDKDADKHEKMAGMADEIGEYLAEHNNSLKGFKFKSVPNGITNIKVNCDEYYGDGKNDELTFDEDGNGIVKKVIDGITIELSYKLDGKQYAIGGVYEQDEPVKDEAEPQKNDVADKDTKNKTDTTT